MDFLRQLYRDNMFTMDNLAPFVSKFYYEGKRRREYLVRFSVLMILSTVIATYGVIADAVATVIGAMIIAPLMMPIMAMATALVMGRLDRAGRSLLVVTLGAIASIFVAKILADTNIGFIDVEGNSQIMSRVTPNITDLYVALASGAVAAFAMSRDDISDSLPGAAIAIALVPPLAVVGVCLSTGNYSEAFGALILFLTNFFSIIIAGSIILHLLGLSRVVTRRIQEEEKGKLKKAFITIIVGMVLVAVPLIITSHRLALSAMVYNDVEKIVIEWTEGTTYRLRNLDVDVKNVDIILAGEGDILNFDELVGSLKDTMGEKIIVNLEAVQSGHHEYPENLQ